MQPSSPVTFTDSTCNMHHTGSPLTRYFVQNLTAPNALSTCTLHAFKGIQVVDRARSWHVQSGWSKRRGGLKTTRRLVKGFRYLITKESNLRDHIYCGFWDLNPYNNVVSGPLWFFGTSTFAIIVSDTNSYNNGIWTLMVFGTSILIMMVSGPSASRKLLNNLLHACHMQRHSVLAVPAVSS